MFATDWIISGSFQKTLIFAQSDLSSNELNFEEFSVYVVLNYIKYFSWTFKLCAANKVDQTIFSQTREKSDILGNKHICFIVDS